MINAEPDGPANLGAIGDVFIRKSSICGAFMKGYNDTLAIVLPVAEAKFHNAD